MLKNLVPGQRRGAPWVNLLWVAAAVLGTAALRAQCPAHGSTPVEEVLRTEALACSKASDSKNVCPLGDKHGSGDSATAYALIKDCSPLKPRGYLVVPTAKITGIESAEIVSKPYEKLWSDAWEWSQRFPDVEESWAALAVNSIRARTVDQLHVHVSCLRGEVRDQLLRHRAEIEAAGEAPYRLAVLQKDPDTGEGSCAVYRVAKVSRLGGAENPRKVAESMHPKERSVYSMDLAVARATGLGSFYVMTYERGGTVQGSAEALLDQTCGDAVKAQNSSSQNSTANLPPQTTEEAQCEALKEKTAPR